MAASKSQMLSKPDVDAYLQKVGAQFIVSRNGTSLYKTRNDNFVKVRALAVPGQYLVSIGSSACNC